MRDQCGAKNYFACAREERNLVAILYHLFLTLSRAELQHVLKELGVSDSEYPLDSETHNQSGFGMYYEYAFVRDLWNNIGKEKSSPEEIDAQNMKRLAVIKNLVDEKVWTALELDKKDNSHDFNKVFNAYLRTDKSNSIHCPSSWRLKPDAGGDLELIKKAFNAKPDLVIHTSSDRAICFEFKFTSGASKDKGHDQLVIQKKIFEILGVKSRMFFVTPSGRKSSVEGVEALSWRDMVGKLGEIERCRTTLERPFIKQMFAEVLRV
jgi:hypothetical protein